MMMKDLLFSFHICQGKNISFAYAMVFENLKKVSFNIASEVHKNWKTEACSQSVLPDRSNVIGKKM